MKRILVLGGSFDPPHVGHLGLGRFVSQFCSAVWVIPCGYRSDKHSMSESHHRLEMAKLMFPDFIVLDEEIRHGPMIPTYILMKQLQEANKDIELRLVISTDLILTLGAWDFSEQLVNEIKFLVVDRPGIELDQDIEYQFKAKENFMFVGNDDSSIELSSTQIRKMFKEFDQAELSVNHRKERALQTGYLSESLIDYILANNLYVH